MVGRIQPSLRDSIDIRLRDPGVETPGYFHGVPPGRRPGIGLGATKEQEGRTFRSGRVHIAGGRGGHRESGALIAHI